MSEEEMTLYFVKFMNIHCNDMNFEDILNYLFGIAETSFYKTRLCNEVRFDLYLRNCSVALDLNEQIYLLGLDLTREDRVYLIWAIIYIVCFQCRNNEKQGFLQSFDFKYGAIGSARDHV